jgi:hypothetical protein
MRQPSKASPSRSCSARPNGKKGSRKIRGEQTTLVPGQPCSLTDVLSKETELPQTWWRELHRSLDVLATTPTRRVCVSSDHVVSRVRAYLGIDLNPNTLTWTTIHGDLHWANLHGYQNLVEPLGNRAAVLSAPSPR